MKYIYFNYPHVAGLNHIKDRVTEFIKLSLILKLIPILPPMYLIDAHTKKKKSELTDYVKLPDFVCRVLPVDKKNIFYWDVHTHHTPNNHLYQKHKKEITRMHLHLDFLDVYK